MFLTFNNKIMRFCYLSGLSPRFQGLSQSSWAGCLRITHPFASISSQQAGHPSIDLHVLGTPPAFILSQDQTLHLIDSIFTDISISASYINLDVRFCVLYSCSVFKELSAVLSNSPMIISSCLPAVNCFFHKFFSLCHLLSFSSQ